MELLDLEKEMLGFYVSGHPLDAYGGRLSRKGQTEIAALAVAAKNAQEGVQGSPGTQDTSGTASAKGAHGTQATKGAHSSQLTAGTKGAQSAQDAQVSLVGLITNLSQRFTKKGELMANFTLEDKSGAVRCTVFPRAYNNLRQYLANGRVLFVEGKLKAEDGASQVLVNGIKQPVLYLRLNSEKEAALMQEICGFLAVYPGPTPVWAYYADVKDYAPFPGLAGISVDKAALAALDNLLGQENVAFGVPK
jgi:DNA polymerase-3 subunit alpha